MEECGDAFDFSGHANTLKRLEQPAAAFHEQTAALAGLEAVARVLIPTPYTAVDPAMQPAVPTRLLPLLEDALPFQKHDPTSWKRKFLITGLVKHCSRVNRSVFTALRLLEDWEQWRRQD